jgi:hypothetical protein
MYFTDMGALPTPLVAGLSKFYRQFLFYFHAVSPCNSLTCENDGSCVVNNGVANCYCYGDFSGSNCEGKVHELDVDISVKYMSMVKLHENKREIAYKTCLALPLVE